MIVTVLKILFDSTCQIDQTFLLWEIIPLYLHCHLHYHIYILFYALDQILWGPNSSGLWWLLFWRWPLYLPVGLHPRVIVIPFFLSMWGSVPDFMVVSNQYQYLDMLYYNFFWDKIWGHLRYVDFFISVLLKAFILFGDFWRFAGASLFHSFAVKIWYFLNRDSRFLLFLYQNTLCITYISKVIHTGIGAVTLLVWYFLSTIFVISGTFKRFNFNFVFSCSLSGAKRINHSWNFFTVVFFYFVWVVRLIYCEVSLEASHCMLFFRPL